MSFLTEPTFVTVQFFPPPELQQLLLLVTVTTTALTRVFGNISEKSVFLRKRGWLMLLRKTVSVYFENGMKNLMYTVWTRFGISSC
jgi:hypothetical protein